MADALPEDPVARAKAIAMKLTATAAPTDDFSQAPGANPGQTFSQAPAPGTESGEGHEHVP